MLEMLIKPHKARRRPWELFFIGLFYASVAVLLVSFVFSGDTILREGSGLLIVLFTVISCLPFVYFTIKHEEGNDLEISKSGRLLKEHSKALKAFMWLFLGFVVAFSFWYIALPAQAPQNFNFQIKVFCAINNPSNYNYCIEQHGISAVTGAATKSGIVMSIFANNIYVLIFTILLSLAFGAGAIFVLVWNASVIGAAIGIFAQRSLVRLPIGLVRYMFHGVPEILAYFVGALAGGIVSVAIIRKDLRGERTWRILQDALILIILAVIILFLSALLEVYVTPALGLK